MTYAWLLLAVCALCTFGERLLPFVLFANRPVPKAAEALGRMLPPAVMTALVIYCLRGMTFGSLSGWVPMLLASLATVGLHLLFSNTLVSIAGGTVLYMILLRLF